MTATDRHAVVTIAKKPPGWEHLFKVPGCEWEDQTDGLKAIHVTIEHVKHIVVYAYHRSSEFNVVTYFENEYTGTENEQWMGPMEALCVLLEAVKERDAICSSPSQYCSVPV